MATDERITSILNGEVTAAIADEAEMAAYSRRYQAVARGRGESLARRDGALSALARYATDALLIARDHRKELEALAETLQADLYATHERYCAEHPYPPDPESDGPVESLDD